MQHLLTLCIFIFVLLLQNNRITCLKWSNQTMQKFYMRIAIEQAKEAVSTGGAPYGALIVDPNEEKVVVKGRNHAGHNPIWHAEMDAINNLNSLLPKNISVYSIAKNMELYTTAESCSMCMSAITWSGFGRVIYGTSIPYIESQGQNQIDIRSIEVAKASSKFTNVTVIGGVLTEETNELYNKNSNYQKHDGEHNHHYHNHHHDHD
jgi:tRNA(adenine34) deaminase